jgi:sulfite reductase (NADPH) flavoprotein alpha-component
MSTHGDGDPPPAAKKFYDHLMETGTQFPNLEFALLALGDSSYPLFCKAGEEVHNRLVALGATPVFPLQKCDIDYQEEANNWFQLYLNSFPSAAPAPPVPPKKAPHTKKWYSGIIKTNINLNGHTSSKETHHLEIRTLEPVMYEPGDALGVIPKNKKSTVDEILSLLQVDSNLSVPYKGSAYTLSNLLTQTFNLCYLKESQVQKYADLTGHEIPKVRMDLLDLLKIYPVRNSRQFIEFTAHLTEQLPRLYSICSSPQAREFELHILVGKNSFEAHGENRFGLCSEQLNELNEGTPIEFYIHKNKSFRHPSPDTDIILIGPGTGIAPCGLLLKTATHQELQEGTGSFLANNILSPIFITRPRFSSMPAPASFTRLIWPGPEIRKKNSMSSTACAKKEKNCTNGSGAGPMYLSAGPAAR